MVATKLDFLLTYLTEIYLPFQKYQLLEQEKSKWLNCYIFADSCIYIDIHVEKTTAITEIKYRLFDVICVEVYSLSGRTRYE